MNIYGFTDHESKRFYYMHMHEAVKFAMEESARTKADVLIRLYIVDKMNLPMAVKLLNFPDRPELWSNHRLSYKIARWVNDKVFVVNVPQKV